MARRNKTTLVDLVALMPWWAGVVLAILSYALLHYVASQVWREQDFDPARGVVYQTYDLDGYLLVNARAGYRLLRDRVELGLVGTNLTDNRARQHPFGAPLGARVMGTVTMRY